MCQLSVCLQAYFSTTFSSEVVEYIIRQFDPTEEQELPSNELAVSMVKLVLQVKGGLYMYYMSCVAVNGYTVVFQDFITLLLILTQYSSN